MILTPEDVKKLLVSVLEGLTGLGSGRVIWETSGGPRPSEGLYCSLWWKDFELLPQNVGDYTAPTGPDPDKARPITQHLRHESWCTVQISFWGPKAFESAVRTVLALQSDDRSFDLWKVLGYGGTDAVQDLSTAFRGRIQARCFFNLSFYACFGADYPAEWFDISQCGIKYAGEIEDFEYSKADREVPDDCSCLKGEQ
ncbi:MULTISPECIES: phage neck terminator protein [unclassified Desulfovibrio]|uniref:phage neck terminator protein n=1 Tax=unclassified Desulfovibrio TaxID=2593640 RepID=UPI002FDB6407